MAKRTKRSRSSAKGVEADNDRPVTVTIDSIRKWLTGWMVTTIAIPVALVMLGIVVTNHWSRPQLSVAVAKAVIASYRAALPDGVHEYRTVVDLQNSCVAWLIDHYAAGEDVMPPPTAPRYPQLVYGAYLRNLGRSQLTEIRLSFRSHSGTLEVRGSPQLALSQTQQQDPEGQTVLTVTVASLAPHSVGVILATVAVPHGSVTVEQRGPDNLGIHCDLGEFDRTPATSHQVRFVGSAQLSDTALQYISMNELLTRQSETFGLTEVYPPIDPVELSPKGGHASFRVVRAPYMACPTSAPEGTYAVPIRQRGK